MKEIRINNFEEKIFYEKLENGLEVYFLPLLNKKNYMCSYGVKYGGRNTIFEVDGKRYNTPTGIAHFLEHKMFERDDDPFSFYNKTGTDVNAGTSYDFTHYYIMGNSNFNNNLKYMINWLKKIDITDELVEKEKGIILEEANMYKDSPARILNEKVKENIFKEDTYRNKVIGSDDDIKIMNRNDIELCFNSFYRPDNMFLICAGNFDKDKALSIIKENISDIKKPNQIVKKIYNKEPDEVAKKSEVVKLNIDIPRISVAYKFNKNIFKVLKASNFELDLYLHIFISIALGPTSKIREKWIKENLFISSMYRITEIDTHYVIEFSALTNFPDKLKKELTRYLNNIVLDEDAFLREKKLWIANEIESITNITSSVYNIMDDVLDYKEYVPNKMEIIKSLKYENVLKMRDILDFFNETTVKLMPKK